MKNKKILVLLTLAIIITACLLNKPDDTITPLPPVVEKETQLERELWLSNKAINSDYQGELVFDSAIINKSFVQAKTVFDANGDLYHFYTENGHLVTDPGNYTGNDVYIWTNWKDMTYDYNILGGSIFMDYRNKLTDQNITIYGHHFSKSGGNDPERIKAFTPLEKALDKNNVDSFRKTKLVLDNETRFYELAYVYKFNTNDEIYNIKCQYYRCNYNYDEFNGLIEEDYYRNYINTLEQVKLYDTGVKLTTSDKTLTLQTCITGFDGQVFEILVFKEVEVKYYT